MSATGPELELVVLGTQPEAPGVTTITFGEASGDAVPFLPGQYLTVYFKDSTTHEGKAYSLSSAPGERLAITVRAIGEFSNKIAALKPGDRLAVSRPYGFFTPESNLSPLVLIAGGIGIAPMRSIVRESRAGQATRQIALFHSARTLGDAIFRPEFLTLAQTMPNFSMTYFVTREEPPGEDKVLAGRMNAKTVLKRTPWSEHTEFLVCGSIPFARDLWRDLREHGVSEDRILTEAFFKQ